MPVSGELVSPTWVEMQARHLHLALNMVLIRDANGLSGTCAVGRIVDAILTNAMSSTSQAQ